MIERAGRAEGPDPGQNSRGIGLRTAIALTVGNMVGVGLFLTPGAVATASPSVVLYVAFWVLGGLVAVAGALSTAELGTMLPHSGGDYVFLSKAFGPPVAYAWGWLSVAATFSGSIAALAIGTTETLGMAFGKDLFPSYSLGPVSVSWEQLAAIGIVWMVTAMHCRSVRLAGRLQSVLTWSPILVFLGAIGWFFLAGDVDPVNTSRTVTGESFDPGLASAAFAAVFFAYSGWNVVTYVGGEVKSPGRTVPLAIGIALSVVIVVYVAVNGLFLVTVPLAEMADAPNVGVAAASRLFGPIGADVFAALLTCSFLAGLNVTAMAGSRISVAMANDGFLIPAMGRLHQKRGTPVVALNVQALWSTLLLLTGGFEALVTFTGAVMLLLGCVTISTLFVFRRRGLTSSYRTPLYPVTPLFFIIVGVAVLWLGVTSNWYELVIGLVAFGVLVIRGYVIGRRKAPCGSLEFSDRD